ncbi:U-box domain-containing protein 13-like [Cornus florida]|uniref:U-box domain-containing protein 13-like n=1 Tax=Cornus florida TaxID=4283 RepID=UPI002897E136|nr:U-box domain-containing protein 13-like [Cornus florida]
MFITLLQLHPNEVVFTSPLPLPGDTQQFRLNADQLLIDLHLNDLRFNDDSADFIDCNNDRSGKFSTASSQSRRLLVAYDTENSDELSRQLVSNLEASSIEDQKQAAMEIRLLAKNKSENRIKIARTGAIKPLISLISSPDPQL